MLLILGASVALAQSDAQAPAAATKPAATPKPAVKPKANPQANPQAKKPAATTAAAAASPATTGSAPITPVSPAAPKNVRDSYAAIPAAERLSLQSDLTWTGDYNGLINGEFSDRLVAAVKAFQKRNKSKDTGVLNPQERAVLASTAKPLQDEVGWRIADDPITGARLGLPYKLASQTAPGHSGTRWTSAQGQLQIETFRFESSTLAGAFEQQKREPIGRRVGYQVIRPDFFVVSGTQGLKKFYVRGSARNGEVRGLTILYDQAMEGIMDPVVVAMSSAFAPFPPIDAAPDRPQPRRKVEYSTGIVASTAGHIVTDKQAVDGCSVVVIPGHGNAERLTETGELVLLRVYGARDLTPAGLLGASPHGTDVMLVGIADPQAQGGGAAITATRARVGAAGNPRPLEGAPAPGFAGAAAIDSQGRFLGMVVQKPAVVAGPAATQAAVVPLEAMIHFLEANDVSPASGKPGIEEAKASVVRVICVRK